MKRASTLLLVPIIVAGLVALAGCGGGKQPSGGSGAGGPASSNGLPGGGQGGGTASGASGAAGPEGSAAPGGSGWTTDTVSVTHAVQVPPVPTLVGIRTGGHRAEGYDRVTFDFTGPLPGYEVRYVDRIVQDGAGAPVTIPGRRFLQITFRPAQAHDDAGHPTVTTREATLDLAMLRSYAIAGDFEAVITIGLGLDDTVAFRVGELSGRIYLDVAA